MKNATYHVSCLTIYLFSDGSGDYYGDYDGSGDYYDYGDSRNTDAVGKSTKLAQVHVAGSTQLKLKFFFTIKEQNYKKK